MLQRVLLAAVVGVVTALVVALVGVILTEVGFNSVGDFVKGASAVVGLLSAVWYFFTQQTLVR